MNNELQKRLLSAIILIPLSLFILIKGSYFFNFFLLVCLIIALYEWYLMSKNKFYNIPGFFLIILSFYSLYVLRHDTDIDLTIIILILIICISTDVGGYTFGKLFKGPKLTKISPNKTYSGMIGSFFLSIIFSSIYLDYYNIYIIARAEIISFFDFIFIILVSSISQMGDIFVSYFKRKSKIKNTGKIIPGHGGILDRIDGMIFVFPSTCLILNLIN
tara:strand:- start:1121 stop:1771 length:651 start_codon:yes stop_codon:yes gene_type:complete